MLKDDYKIYEEKMNKSIDSAAADFASVRACLLYTSDAADEL